MKQTKNKQTKLSVASPHSLPWLSLDTFAMHRGQSVNKHPSNPQPLVIYCLFAQPARDYRGGTESDAVLWGHGVKTVNAVQSAGQFAVRALTLFFWSARRRRMYWGVSQDRTIKHIMSKCADLYDLRERFFGKMEMKYLYRYSNS